MLKSVLRNQYGEVIDMKKMTKGCSGAFGIHKIGLELIKLAHKIDSSAIPLRIIHAVLRVADVYLRLFLTARLIDSLLGGELRRSLLNGALVVCAALFCGIAETVLAGLYKKSSDRFMIGFYVMMREKAISLDYETMEQPHVAEKIFHSERTSMMYGGLKTVIDVYREMLESLITIGMSLGMTAALCFAKPQTGGILGYVAHPAVSAVLAAIFFGVVLFFYNRGNRKYERENQEIFNNHTDMELKLGYLMSQVIENYEAGKVIRIYDMKKMLLDNFRKFNRESTAFYEKMFEVGNCQNLFKDTVNGFMMIGTYLFVALKVLTGAVTIGGFTQYVGAMTKLAGGCQSLAMTKAEIYKNCVYMRDFLDFMKTENTHWAGTIPVEKRLDGEYEIAFHDVSFRYPGGTEMILKHVNCTLTMKNKLALVGQNGAGKTTFIKLLCRLYEPTEGMITLNGIDIRKYKEEEYRELFGVVFQDFKLFAFPIWCNLAAGYERDDEKLWDCLEKAGAAEFVRNLPKGTDTILFKNKEGGVDISGGEAQKLALARALYKNAPVVVLDEPTAALDPISEAQIYAGFHEMVKDKTSIYISHRMSSCRFCDDIMVFDRGQIVERGSHEELLAKEGQYARMWNAQAKYYVE